MKTEPAAQTAQLEILIQKARQEEKDLRFERFDRYDALELGACLADLTTGSPRPIAVLIVDPQRSDIPVFSWSMEGKEARHFDFARRKIQTVAASGISSWQAKLRQQAYGELADLSACADCCFGAGAFPIRNRQGDLLAIVGLSGLEEPQDHPLLIQALRTVLQKQNTRQTVWSTEKGSSVGRTRLKD